jgi:hypothetical protein
MPDGSPSPAIASTDPHRLGRSPSAWPMCPKGGGSFRNSASATT